MAKRVVRRKAPARRSRPARRSARKARSGEKGTPPKDAVTLVVQLRPREGQDVLLEAELRALVSPTRKEQGCITYELYRSSEGPSAFLLHEVWALREDHTRHTGTPHFLRWNARKDALVASIDRAFWKHIA